MSEKTLEEMCEAHARWRAILRSRILPAPEFVIGPKIVPPPPPEPPQPIWPPHVEHFPVDGWGTTAGRPMDGELDTASDRAKIVAESFGGDWEAYWSSVNTGEHQVGRAADKAAGLKAFPERRVDERVPPPFPFSAYRVMVDG